MPSRSNYNSTFMVTRMMGGLHREMLIFNILGDLLESSGWTTIVNKAGITTSGWAESLLKAIHVTHQVTAATLFSL